MPLLLVGSAKVAFEASALSRPSAAATGLGPSRRAGLLAAAAAGAILQLAAHRSSVVDAATTGLGPSRRAANIMELLAAAAAGAILQLLAHRSSGVDNKVQLN